MWKFISRAWWDTIAETGLSVGTGIRSFLVLVITGLLYYVLKNESDAMMSWETGVYGFLAALAVFLGHFLWNFWLAPYRFLEDRLNSELTGSKKGASDVIVKPQPANVALYQNHKTLSLYEAACLWVEVKPHYPIVDHGAEAKLSYLKGAVRNRELVCEWRAPWTMIHDTLYGLKNKTPTDYQEVSILALRRYAEKINDVPLFLRQVSLPVQSPKKEDDKKPSAPSTD